MFVRPIVTGALCACLLLSTPISVLAVEEDKIEAGDIADGDEFGRATAISGDTVIVASPLDDDGGSGSGAAYIFVRSGVTWNEQMKLTASDAAAGDTFGISVSIDGDTAAVGAFFNDDAGASSGSVYVFFRTGTTWAEQMKLTASDAQAGDQFGRSVCIDGDTLVVGADRDDDSGSDSGSAYVFVRTGTTWNEQAKLLSSDGASGDTFGRSVSCSGDTALVGAFHDGDAGMNSGSAYVFVRTGTTWGEEMKLTASDAAAGDVFGEFVSLSGESALIGAIGNDDNGADSGTAYVFLRTGTTWGEQAILSAGDGAAGDEFGKSLAIDGDKAVIGAYLDNGGVSGSGSAYAFLRTGTSWSESTQFTAGDQQADDNLGFWVGFSNDTAVVSGHLDDDPGTDSGAAYIFIFDNTVPTITCPANMTVECTSQSGAIVNFTPTAADDRDPNPAISCNPASGSLFGFGTTQVDCMATDASGNDSIVCSFDVTVQDTTGPDITCPADFDAECEGPTGAVVNFSVTATDTCDPAPSVSSVPVSGSLFPMGTTQVTSTSMDATGNMSQCMFDVTVVDTTVPDVTCPGNMIVECTDPAGTPVTYSVTATDICDDDVSVVVVPPSGSLFSQGMTMVTATATDDDTNSAMCSFMVTVEDTTGPSIGCPADINVGCTDPGGSIVMFTVTATDNCDSNPSVSSVPPSGSLFPVGTTLVTSTAMDATGNMSMCTFNVTVGANVVPANGSELGDNHINIFGCGFTDVPDTTVLFDGIAATVLTVTQDQIAVRTPAGIGTVDVTIMNTNGTSVLSAAYTYVDPAIAARFGNVNVLLGDREDVLLVNGSPGNFERIVDVAINDPFGLEILVPTSRTFSRYVVWAWAGISTLADIEAAPLDIGVTAFPPVYANRPPQPVKIFNLLGHKPTLGCPDVPSQPAPHKFFCTNGRGTAITVTFQGLVRDNGARADLGAQDYSVTNAVTLRIQ